MSETEGLLSRLRRAEAALQTRIEPTRDGWSIRLPIHAEEVRLDKRLVIYGEVEVRREVVGALEQPAKSLRPEERQGDPEAEDVGERQPLWVRARVCRHAPTANELGGSKTAGAVRGNGEGIVGAGDSPAARRGESEAVQSTRSRRRA